MTFAVPLPPATLSVYNALVLCASLVPGRWRGVSENLSLASERRDVVNGSCLGPHT